VRIGADPTRLFNYSQGQESFIDVNPHEDGYSSIKLEKKKIIAQGDSWVLFVTREYAIEIVNELQVFLSYL
jgi:hypothetical protein